MKKIRNIIPLVAVALLGSCSALHQEYKSDLTVPNNLYGDQQEIVASTAQPSIATLSWRQLFADPYLQRLIDTALVRNTDLAVTRLHVQQAEASLKAAKQAFLPSLTFNPNGGVNYFNKTTTGVYNVGLTAQWQADIFGSMKNKKRQSEAVLEQARDFEQATQSQLVTGVAMAYYKLLLCKGQLEIMQQTKGLWEKQLVTQRALYENGRAYSTSVNQMQASLLGVEAQIADMQFEIQRAENAICILLCQPHTTIEHSSTVGRGHLLSSLGTSTLGSGLPIEMLANRPDVRAAQRAVEAAFYVKQQAKADFYPNLTLSGTLGFTNNGGVVDPGKILLSALGELTAPIFARGQIKAKYAISELQQEEAKQQFVNTTINAGMEVNEALMMYNSAAGKDAIYSKQVAVLQDAYKGTQELMANGKATYIEVLTAREALLSAQLDELSNLYQATQGLIALYQALGGGSL